MATPELKQLGRYAIESTLGQGAMGVVYGATDSTLHRKVAIKTILKSALDPETARQYSLRFMREAQAVARLNHPNIVQVHDFGEEGDIAFIVMEFIKGKELQDYFDAKQRFEVKEAVRIMCELCDALQFAHDAGIIHRDIKPANVMIDAQGKVKLADFGVARITDADRTLTERTQAGTMIGTPAYMSPEQISGGEIDRRTDIFSAGIILYQFLTGERAFVGEGAWTIAKKIIQDHPPSPSTINKTISPLFDRVVNKALAKGVKERYQTARDLGAALRLALEGKSREEDGSAPAAAPVEAPRRAAPAPQVAPTNPGTQEVELEFWRAIKDGNDPDDFDLYVQQFPSGIYAELARRKIAKLRGTALEENAQKAAAQEKRALEEAALREAEARARLAEEKARLNEEKARLEAQLAQKDAEFRKREAEAEARRQAEAKARADEIARARSETEALLARRAAEDRAQKAADENSRRAAEARAKYDAAERAKREQELAKREAELTQRMASVPGKRSFLLPSIVAAAVVLAIGVGVFAWKRSDSPADAKHMAELVAQLEQYKQREAELKQSREQGAKLDQEAEQARQRETEMQKQAEVARQREAEAKKAGDLAKQRELAELAAQREAEAKKQAEFTRQREAEAKKQAELTRQREAEAKKQAESAKQQQAELARLEAQRKQASADKASSEKAAQAKAVAEKAAEASRQAASQKQAEAERLAKLEADRQAQVVAAERAAAEQRAAAERAAAEKAAAEKAVAEKAAAEKAKVAAAAPAASAGGAEALYNQAAALENEKKYAEAVRVYIQAARSGSGQAAKKLGDLYGKGAPGVTIDSTESIKWYNFARLRGVQ